MKTGLLLLIFFLSINSYRNASGQNSKHDSLWNEYKIAKHDTTRIQRLLDIGAIYMYENPDTALLYFDNALALSNKNITLLHSDFHHSGFTFIKLNATILLYMGVVYSRAGNFERGIECCLKALKIFKELSGQREYPLFKKESKTRMSDCFNQIGFAQASQGNFDASIEYFLESLKINEESGNKKGIFSSCINIGNVCRKQGDYKNSLIYYLKSSKIVEELNDQEGISMVYNNIGNVYKFQGSPDKALEYYLKSLKIFEKLGNIKGMSINYNNIGNIYKKLKKYDEAIEYYSKSLNISEKSGDKDVISNCYGNIGDVRLKQGQFDESIDYYLKSLKIFKELGDKNGIASINGYLASLYIILADSSASILRNDHLFKALGYAKKSYDLAVEIGSFPEQNDATANLQLAYTKLGRYKEALKYAELYISTKDSMFSKEKTDALAEMTTRYEAQKKQLQIEKMMKQKELDDKTIEAQNAENRKQRIIMVSFISGFILILVFSIIILRMFRQKHKANKLLALQNDEIRQQKEEITAQRDEIEAQRDKLFQQKNFIEAQKKEITDSINYARHIQQALLPSVQYAESILGEHFILFKPKDIVSGDFYWSTQINEWLIITVADCTGHGVPGAFMSMLGISFLNEIVGKKEIIKASEILNQLRESVIEALQQKGQSGEQKDGMNIALIVFNTSNYQLQFSGAHNPLYIVNADKELNEIAPDKQPVAIYVKMKPFTNHEINLKKGDCIYLASDGYGDQFGGSDCKKFKTKQLKELFVSISEQTMTEQRKILDTTFENWKGNHEQIDDVTILGLRIN